MLAHRTIVKCRLVGVSCYNKRKQHSSIRKPQRVSFPSAYSRTRNFSRQLKIHPKAVGCRYKIVAPQVVEKMESKTDVIDYLQESDFSNSYETAMEALSSLITRQKRGDGSSINSKYGKLDRMQMYLKILDLEDKIERLNIIHVAGTKGKGSTCTFCEAILRECGLKTGLFTSPHLIDVRERFRIDGLSITEDKFLLYFWDCWNQLKEHLTEDLPMPPLFQFLTVLAFKIFLCEQVDVAVVEVGLGGKRDSTNVIKKPVVCGVTSLGMDHMETLGDTLGQIASHKAGIFKAHVPAFTVPQPSEAMDVIQQKADELMIPLTVAPPLDHEGSEGLTLGLDGDHQFTNAGLAVSLCKYWLQRTGKWNVLFQNDKQQNDLPDPFIKGLSTAHLSGRAQIVYDSSSEYDTSSRGSENCAGGLTFYLDGAHSPESMEACAKWFSNAVDGNRKFLTSISSSSDDESMNELPENGFLRFNETNTEVFNRFSKKILLFNCMDVRDPHVLLPRLVTTCASSGTYFSKAIFVPSMSTYNKVTSGSSVIPLDIYNKNLSWQFNLQRIWEKIIHGIEVDALLDNSTKMDHAVTLPSHEFLYEDPSHCSLANGHFTCSTVVSSLPLTINWLRDCVRENPSLKLQVLVTGSLHLVGDVLKLLRR